MTQTRPLDFGISTCCYGNEPLAPRHLDAIHAMGFRRIELFANRPHLDYKDRARMREIIGWFRANPTAQPSLHLPFAEQTGERTSRFISGLDPEEKRRSEARDEIRRALEITDHLPVSWVVVHFGTPRQRFSPVLFDHAYALVDAIQRFAGVDVLIETLPNEISQPERILEFIGVTRLPGVRICYDVGHCHLEGVSVRFDKAGAAHLNDNDGRSDQHLWPFMGSLDWPRLAAALVESGFSGPLILEGPDADLQTARDQAARFERLVREARASTGAFAEGR